jgi:hypothetical protein
VIMEQFEKYYVSVYVEKTNASKASLWLMKKRYGTKGEDWLYGKGQYLFLIGNQEQRRLTTLFALKFKGGDGPGFTNLGTRP